jgi:hypothetical protein
MGRGERVKEQGTYREIEQGRIGGGWSERVSEEYLESR